MKVDKVIERISYRLPTDDGRIIAGSGWLCDEASVRAVDVAAVQEVSGDHSGGRYAIIELADGDSWLVRGDVSEIREILVKELRAHRYPGPVEIDACASS